MSNSLDLRMPVSPLTELCVNKSASLMVLSCLANKSLTMVCSFDQNYEAIKETLLSNIKGLKVPAKWSVKELLQNYGSFMLSEILCFFLRPKSRSGLQILFTSDQFLRNVTFTPQGRLDDENSYRNMVRDDTLNSLSKYILACRYFFEEEVRHLWTQIEVQLRIHFCKVWYMSDIGVTFWSLKLMNLNDKLNQFVKDSLIFKDSITQLGERAFETDEYVRMGVNGCALACSLLDNNVCACKYLWRRCTDDQKQPIFNKIANDVAGLDKGTILFYYSIMSQEHFKNLIKTERSAIEQLFYNLPSELFVGTYSKLNSVINCASFYCVLMTIADKDVTVIDEYISPDNMKWDKVFRDIWVQEASETFRCYVLSEIDDENNMGVAFLIKTLYDNGHFESLELLLSYQNTNHRRIAILGLMTDQFSASVLKLLNRYHRQIMTSREELKCLKENVPTEIELQQEWNALFCKIERSLKEK